MEDARLLNADALLTARRNLPASASEVTASIAALTEALKTLESRFVTQPAVTGTPAPAAGSPPESDAVRVAREAENDFQRRQGILKRGQLRGQLQGLRAAIEQIQREHANRPRLGFWGYDKALEQQFAAAALILEKIDQTSTDLTASMRSKGDLPEVKITAPKADEKQSVNTLIVEELKKLDNRRRPQSDQLHAFVRSRIDMLTYEAFGSSNDQVVPMELFDLALTQQKKDAPEVDVDAVPGVVSASRVGKNTMVFAARGLDATKPMTAFLRPAASSSVAAPGVSAPAHAYAWGSESLIVEIDIDRPDLAATATAELVVAIPREKNGERKVEQKVIATIAFDRPPPTPAVAKGASFQVIRDAGGRVTGFSVKPPDNGDTIPLTPEEIEKLLKALGTDHSGSLEMKVGGSADVDIKAKAN